MTLTAQRVFWSCKVWWAALGCGPNDVCLLPESGRKSNGAVTSAFSQEETFAKHQRGLVALRGQASVRVRRQVDRSGPVSSWTAILLRIENRGIAISRFLAGLRAAIRHQSAGLRHKNIPEKNSVKRHCPVRLLIPPAGIGYKLNQ